MLIVGDRLKEERNRLNFNQTDFAERCGVKRGTQISYEQNKNKPDSEYLTNAYKVGVDVNYVLTGQRVDHIKPIESENEKLKLDNTLYMHNNDEDAGIRVRNNARKHVAEMSEQASNIEKKLKITDKFDRNIVATTLFHALSGNKMSIEKIDTAINIINNQAITATEDLAMIPGYNVQVSAGHGAINDNETPTRYLAFRKKWLQYRGFKQDDLVVVFAKGDSMEPTISNNNSLLIHTKFNGIQDGSIYVIRQDENLLVKRVQRLLDGNIKLISDNKTYEPMLLSKETFDALNVVGQVVWIAKDIS